MKKMQLGNHFNKFLLSSKYKRLSKRQKLVIDDLINMQVHDLFERRY